MLARVLVDANDCWLWQGAINGGGYGQIKWQGKVLYVHRIMCPTPPGTEVDHLCRVKRCCNPSHLEAVPHQVNNKRAFPTCRRGHDPADRLPSGKCKPCNDHNNARRQWSGGRCAYV